MMQKLCAVTAVLVTLTACMGSTEDEDTMDTPSTPAGPTAPTTPTSPTPPTAPATSIITVDTSVAAALNAGPTSTTDAFAAFQQINGGVASDPPPAGVASFSGSFAFAGISDSDNSTARTFDGDLEITLRPEFATQDQYLATFDFQNVTDAGGTAVSFNIPNNVLSGRIGPESATFPEISFNDPLSGTVDGQPWQVGISMTGEFANDGEDGLGTITGIGGSNDVNGVFAFSQD